MKKDEIDLIRQAQEGDSLAFDRLIRRYDKQVLTLAYSMVNNTEDAKDIYQEVFVRVFRGLKKFKFESEFSTWLHRITVNYAINFRKRRTRYKLFNTNLENDSETSWQFADDSQCPGGEVMNSEFMTQLNETLETLSPQQRSVFVLRHYHGHKLKEIASIMNCNIGTVKNYLYRATQKVQQQLHEYVND